MSRKFWSSIAAGFVTLVACISTPGASARPVVTPEAPAVAEAVALVAPWTATVDASGAVAPAWRSRQWTPTTTGPVTIQMSWTGGGALQMDLRRASDRKWIAAATNTANPKVMTATLEAGTTYRLAVWAVSGVGTFTAVTDDGTARPNILIVLSDDQRPDAIQQMPNVKKWFAAPGITFPKGYVTTPSCCPARASILTGRYDHNNGVVQQTGPAFDESTSIARYLKQVGYTTGFIGKYVHYYPLSGRAPYWDRWTYWKGGYENVWMNFDGQIRQSSVYSTRVAFDTAISYVNSWEAADSTPWLMIVAPTAPHRRGQDPPPVEPQYATAPVAPLARTPATFEADRSDKPPFLYCCTVTETYINDVYTGMTRAAMSIDDGVDRLFQRLGAAGELDNTLAFYLSDNGWLFGDHNLMEKFVPYSNSVGVPFLMRWSARLGGGTTDQRFASNIDIVPTALAAAGAAPTTAVDGRDLIGGSPRSRRLTEYWQDPGNVKSIPDWASLTTATYEYTEYYEVDSTTVRFREYYNLANDPYRLVNLFADGVPANDPNVQTISAQLRADRTCRGAACP